MKLTNKTRVSILNGGTGSRVVFTLGVVTRGTSASVQDALNWLVQAGYRPLIVDEARDKIISLRKIIGS